MKALVLAAGYATRLYPITEHTPKPLLKVGGKPIVEHILHKLKEVKEISAVFLVTNHRFYQSFRSWLLQDWPEVQLINDGTLNNEDRLGAVGDLNFVLQEEEINDDLLVIAGDNLFGFSLKDLVKFFQDKRKSVVALHDLKEKEKVKKRYGVAQLESSKIIHFEEKPALPKSSLASTACYLFAKEDLPQVAKALQQGKADNPGDLIQWLVKNSEVQGFVFTEHWFDVGTPESLAEAENFYRGKA